MQMRRDDARQLYPLSSDIHNNWRKEDVNVFDLQLSRLTTREPLNIARNALKEALKTNPDTPEKALSVFAANREWKQSFGKDEAGIKKVLSDARSNPEIFKELSQEIAGEKEMKAKAPRREQPQPSPHPPLPKQTPRPVPTKPAQAQKSSEIPAEPIEWLHPSVNMFEYFEKNKMINPPAYYNLAMMTISQKLSGGKVTEENKKNIINELKKMEHPPLNSAMRDKLVKDAGTYLQRMV
jgi:hypothetical protein